MTSLGTSDYLLIHGKWYNIKDFKHPGGPIAIGLGRGRDATALFEAHHPFTSRSKLKALLAKYAVSEEEATKLGLKTLDSKGKKKTVFDWGTGGIDRDMSPFEKELKEEVTAYFQKQANKRGISLLQATKATPIRWLEIFMWLVVFLCTLPYFVTGSWWAMVITPVLAWLLAANTSHDAMHFSLSTNWRINAIFGYFAPWTSSPLMWYHQHVIGHHAYPNVGFKDPDLAHAPALMRVHDSISWKSSHKYQMIWTPIIWTLGATLYMTVVPFKTLLKGNFNRSVFVSLSKKRTLQHIFGRFVVASSLWLWPWFVFPAWQALIWCTVPMFIHSFCFMACTQMNHLTQQNIQMEDSNYSKHQVVTSHSFSPYSKLLFHLTGGLNLQIEHHLFPTVNHCHLPQLHFIVKTCCAKHNVPYHQSDNFGEALQKYIDHIYAMSVSPSKSVKKSY
jgi:fatty acid desaturase